MRQDHDQELAAATVPAPAVGARPAIPFEAGSHLVGTGTAYFGPRVMPRRAAVLGTLARFNRTDDGTMVVPSEYLEAVFVRR